MKTPNNNFRNRLVKARRRGLSLMETAMALAVVSLLLVFFVNLTQVETDRVRVKNTADKLATISKAAEAYMAANYAKLLADAPSVGSGALEIEVGRTEPGGGVPADSLQDEGYLPPSFVDANSFQQNTKLLVRKVNEKTLEAILTTHGGQTIPDRMLGNMANLLGASGGYMPETVPGAASGGEILGVGGGWRADADEWRGSGGTEPEVGTIQMSMAFEDGSLLKDYLYRNDVGVPEANRMNTDIDMNSQAINRTGKITGLNDAKVGGTSVLIGDTSDPNSLRATRDIWADRDIRADNDVAAGRDVTAARNVRAEGETSGGTVRSDTTVTAGTDVVAMRDVRAGNDLAVGRNATIAGNTKVGGDLEANRININAKVFGPDVGGGNRPFAADLTLGDMLPRMVPQYSYVASEATSVVPKPTCRGGYGNARVMVYRQVDSTRSIPNVPLSTSSSDGYLTSASQNVGGSYVDATTGVIAKDGGSTWTLQWVGDPKAPGTTRQVLAQTFCFYG